MTDETPAAALAAEVAVRAGGRDLAADDLAYLNRMTTVGQVLPNTAHELNNALQIVGGIVELLSLRADLPEDIREKIGRIGAQTARATEMIRELVAFARREDAGTVLLDVSKVVERSLVFRRYHLARARIGVTVDARPGAAVARLDGHALQQLLLNLIVNAEQALKGQPDARITIRVRQDGDVVEIRVSDNGTGLAADLREQALQPFFTTHRPAAGLGLTVAAYLARAQGGALAVEEAEGGGTVAIVTLPALRPLGR